MNAQDYLEWSRISGLYLRNVSHVDRYRTYQPLLSPAGLITVIVAEFLDGADPVVDVGNWRTFSVYEMGDEQHERISRTAEALEAIGATRIAAAVRTAQSNSPFEKIANAFASGALKGMVDLSELMEGMKGVDLLNHMRENVVRNMPDIAEEAGIKSQAPEAPPVSPDYESREQIEHLLEQFVASHRTELERDLNRHGDPRREPGYTPKGREKELDQMRQRMVAVEGQVDDASKLQGMIEQIAKLTGNPGETSKKTQSKLEKLRREFRQLVKLNQRIAPNELIPEMSEALKAADAIIKSRPDLFAPKKLGDDKITSRLEALGEYETSKSGGRIEIQWDDPNGLDCEWTTFSLMICYPKSKPELLERLLDAVDRLRGDWSQHLDEWRSELLTRFRDVYQPQMQDWEFEDYEVDDEDNATDESILAHVGGGQLTLEVDPEEGSIFTQGFFGVEWDDEHGFEFGWDPGFEGDNQDQGVVPADQSQIDVSSLGLTNIGPKLNGADIVKFESTFGIELPPEYRQFLLSANGGAPERKAFTASIGGDKIPAEVIRFFSITGEYSSSSLEAAAEHARAQKWPNEVLPIAQAQYSGPMMVQMDPSVTSIFLALVLSGPKSGRVLLVSPDMLYPGLPVEAAQQLAAAMMGQMLDYSPMAGRTLSELITKLKKPASDKSPAWLKAIREDNIEEFAKWIQSGGTSKESHQEKPYPIPLQAIDYLACHASTNLLQRASELNFFMPSQLRESWDKYCQRDLRRFRVMMPVLPKEMWKSAMSSYQAWSDPSLWEELAVAGVDFNDPVDDEGQTPIHLAVQTGSTAAVKWLMEHGADPQKFDKYQRNAFTWTDHGPGYDCLDILKGKVKTTPARSAQQDVSGMAVLHEAAQALPRDTSLVLVIQIKSPPVTETEKRWSNECHYRLSFDIQRKCVTFNDMTSARQAYLNTEQPWPALLFAPVLQWPELTPLWETLEVQEFDWPVAVKKRKYQPKPRPDLLDAASEALHQSLNVEEAEVRGIKIRK